MGPLGGCEMRQCPAGGVPASHSSQQGPRRRRREVSLLEEAPSAAEAGWELRGKKGTEWTERP